MNTSSQPAYTDDYANDSYSESEGGQSQLDLQHYLRILRKHKWPITLFTAIVTALAVYYAYTATPIYRAQAQLLIEQQKMSNISLEELYGIESESTDYYETQFELLKSRNLAQRVVERLDLWNHPEFSPSARSASADTQAPVGGVDTAVPTEKPGGLGDQARDLMSRLTGGDEASDPAADAPATGDAGTSTDSAAPGFDATTGTGVTLNLDPSAMNRVPSTLTLEPVSQRLANTELATLTNDQEAMLANFRSRMSISPVRKTKLVSLGFESADPVLAARVANTIGQEYIQSYLDAKLELTTTASTWMNERLGQLRVQLDAAEDRLIAYKEENNLVDVDGTVGRLNDQQLLLLSTELANARSQLSNARDVYATVQSLEGQPELLQSIPAIQADPLVQGVKIEQGTVQRQLDELTNRYGARHPRVIDAQGQLDSLNANLEGQINRLVGTLAKDVQLAQQRVEALNSEIAAGRSEVQAMGSKTFELGALEREVATKREIYDQFFSTITEANSADGLETANARISDLARAPIHPVKPQKQLIIALAALASLVLSMLMAFLYETMDDTVKSTNDIEQKLGIKLLGILPLIKGGLLKSKTDLPLNPAEIKDKRGTFAEAVNTARTALVMDDSEAGRKIVVVTSSVPGEGKSTASINLAHSLGQLERVLLIDCDMRRPTIAKAAGLEKNTTGLANLITGAATARECIKHGVFGGSVDILPSGPIPDQPLELLSSMRFKKILEGLSKHYDRIVIDSAPTQAVSDALVLGKLADAVVYVIKSHDTSLELVRRGLQRLQQSGAKVAGALITQVDIDKITSYGGDYYYQGYYDYYGYSDKGERTRRPGKITLSQEELIRIKTDDSDIDLGIGPDPYEPDVYEDDMAPRQRGAEPRRQAAARSGEPARRPARAAASRNRFEDDLDIV